MPSIDEATCTAFVVKELSEIVGDTTVNADSSFRQAGGDSLRAILLASAIEEEYETEIDVLDVFEAASLRGLGALIADQAARQRSEVN